MPKKEPLRVVAWPFSGETVIGVIDSAGYVVVALNYKMDSNVEKGDLWYADELYTNAEDLTTDWNLVRPATEAEKTQLLLALAATM